MAAAPLSRATITDGLNDEDARLYAFSRALFLVENIRASLGVFARDSNGYDLKGVMTLWREFPLLGWALGVELVSSPAEGRWALMAGLEVRTGRKQF